MQMPTVTPEHQKLHVFAGEWEGDETMLPGPMGPGGPARGRSTARVDIDGFYVISDYVQEVGGRITYRGHGVYGFDAQAGHYTWYWVDSMGMPSTPSPGTWMGDTLTFQSSHAGGSGRYVYDWRGRDEHDFRIEHSMDGGKTWATFMKATYRRKA